MNLRRRCCFGLLIGLAWILPAWRSEARAESPGEATKRIQADAEEVAKIYLRRLGGEYRSSYDPKSRLLFVTSVDEKTEAHAKRLIREHLRMHRDALFPDPFGYPVTILLPSVGDYRKIVGEVNPKASGFYLRKVRTLASISFSSVLFHELTHAVHHNDQILSGEDHPIWLVEGLASFYQQGKIEKGSFFPEIGGDVTLVQDALKNRGLPSLASLVEMDRKKYLQAPERNYAHSRYVMYYLAKQGKLGDFYAAYKRTYDEDRTGVRALEIVLGEKIDAIDAAWRRWIGQLDPPWKSKLLVKAHLGIRMRDVKEGVEIRAFLPGSAAGRAGVLRLRDVLLSVGGHATATPRDLADAVQTFRPGQTVTIELIREGRRIVVSQILGAIKVKP
jgi:hypothetical protein